MTDNPFDVGYVAPEHVDAPERVADATSAGAHITYHNDLIKVAMPGTLSAAEN